MRRVWGFFVFGALVSMCLFLFMPAVQGHAAKPINRPLEAQPLSSAETISPRQIIGDGIPRLQPQRCDWYRQKLGRYASIINAASRETGIPPHLLAAVVLNELADVGYDDVIQDQQLAETGGDFREVGNAVKYPALHYKPVGKQSFGIAQINPETAIRYNAVPVAGQEKLHRDYVEFRVAYQLLNRPMAIHAAARVIRGILEDIGKHQSGAWARQFMLPGVRFSADDPYAGVSPPAVKASPAAARAKEVTLAYLVTSVYNTGPILTAPPDRTPRAHDVNNPMGYPNALNHASTVRVIAADLAERNGCGMGLLSFEDVKKQRGVIRGGPSPGSDGWVVWYAPKLGYQPFFVTTTYGKDEPSCRYPGGGLDCSVIIQKTHVAGPFKTRDEAVRAACGKLSKIRRLQGGIYAGLLVADYQGKMHNIEGVGDCRR